jgi:hypothetical protein
MNGNRGGSGGVSSPPFMTATLDSASGPAVVLNGASSRAIDSFHKDFSVCGHAGFRQTVGSLS